MVPEIAGAGEDGAVSGSRCVRAGWGCADGADSSVSAAVVHRGAVAERYGRADAGPDSGLSGDGREAGVAARSGEPERDGLRGEHDDRADGGVLRLPGTAIEVALAEVFSCSMAKTPRR